MHYLLIFAVSKFVFVCEKNCNLFSCLYFEVPKIRYTFTFNDNVGDGFSTDNGSYFEVFVNGKSVERVEGNFKDSVKVVIDPNVTHAKSERTTSKGTSVSPTSMMHAFICISGLLLLY